MRMVFFYIAITLFSSYTLAEVDSFKLINGGKETIITTEDLELLPAYEIKTSTNFTPVSVFKGTSFKDLANKYNIVSGELRFFAWDDYSYTIPLSELLNYNAILAYKKNGAYMDLSNLGPFSIIFPRDSFPDIDMLNINAKTVWQVKSVEVVK